MKKKTKKITLGVFSATLAVVAPIATVVSCGKEEESSKLFKTGEIDMKALFKTMDNNVEQNKIKRIPWKILTKDDKKNVGKEWDELTKLALEAVINLSNPNIKNANRMQELNNHFTKKYINETIKKNNILGMPSASIEEYKGKVKEYLEFIRDDVSYGTISLFDPKTNKEIYKKTQPKEIRKEILKFTKKIAMRIYNDANDHGKMLVDIWTKPAESAEKYSEEQLQEIMEHNEQTLEELKNNTREILKIMFPPKQVK